MNPALLLMVLAAEPSPLAVGGHAMLGVSLVRGSGDLPSFASGRAFDRYATWVHFRAGIADSKPTTTLGTQLGAELDLRIGYTPSESEELHDGLPLGFAGRLGMSMRALTFTVPVQGMFVAHVSAELGAGGAHWWSDTARFSLLGGGRLAFGGPGDVNLELDYTLVPFTVGGAPGELKVRRLEHRIVVNAGAGPVGLGVWLTLSREQWRLTDDAPFETTTGRAVGASLEWRP